LREFLRSVSLFSDLDDPELDRLAALAREEKLPAYRMVFREGDPVDALFVVREGTVTVFRDEPGKPQQVLARLPAGSFFGEMGLLNDSPSRFASARTATATALLRIERDDFVAFLADHPRLEIRFRSEIIRRRGMNVALLLDLAGQREVRIRLGVAVVAEWPNGRRDMVVLENLSQGGVGLSGVPPGWQVGFPVHFRLGLADQPAVLEVDGLVAWREAETVGISFAPGAAVDPARLQRALRRFAERVR
jgi:CRP-like cAMP-binding protein